MTRGFPPCRQSRPRGNNGHGPQKCPALPVQAVTGTTRHRYRHHFLRDFPINRVAVRNLDIDDKNAALLCQRLVRFLVPHPHRKVKFAATQNQGAAFEQRAALWVDEVS